MKIISAKKSAALLVILRQTVTWKCRHTSSAANNILACNTDNILLIIISEAFIRRSWY